MSTAEILLVEYLIGRARIYGELAMLASKPLRLDRIRFFCESMRSFIGAVEDEIDQRQLHYSIFAMEEWLKENEGREDEQEFKNERAREFTYLFRFGDDRITDNASAALSKKSWLSGKSGKTASGFTESMALNFVRILKNLKIHLRCRRFLWST